METSGINQDNKKGSFWWDGSTPITYEDILQRANNWSLGADAATASLLQQLSSKLVSRTHEVQASLKSVCENTDELGVSLSNINSSFHLLSNTQFMENRTYQEDERSLVAAHKPKETKEECEETLLSSCRKAINEGLKLVAEMYEKVEISDSESESETRGSPLTVYRRIDPYAERRLPHLIGSDAFRQDHTLGLLEKPPDESAEDVVSGHSVSDVEGDSVVAPVAVSFLNQVDEDDSDSDENFSRRSGSTTATWNSDDRGSASNISSKRVNPPNLVTLPRATPSHKMPNSLLGTLKVSSSDSETEGRLFAPPPSTINSVKSTSSLGETLMPHGLRGPLLVGQTKKAERSLFDSDSEDEGIFSGQPTSVTPASREKKTPQKVPDIISRRKHRQRSRRSIFGSSSSSEEKGEEDEEEEKVKAVPGGTGKIEEESSVQEADKRKPVGGVSLFNASITEAINKQRGTETDLPSASSSSAAVIPDLVKEDRSPKPSSQSSRVSKPHVASLFSDEDDLFGIPPPLPASNSRSGSQSPPPLPTPRRAQPPQNNQNKIDSLFGDSDDDDLFLPGRNSTGSTLAPSSSLFKGVSPRSHLSSSAGAGLFEPPPLPGSSPVSEKKESVPSKKAASYKNIFGSSSEDDMFNPGSLSNQRAFASKGSSAEPVKNIGVKEAKRSDPKPRDDNSKVQTDIKASNEPSITSSKSSITTESKNPKPNASNLFLSSDEDDIFTRSKQNNIESRTSKPTSLFSSEEDLFAVQPNISSKSSQITPKLPTKLSDHISNSVLPTHSNRTERSDQALPTNTHLLSSNHGQKLPSENTLPKTERNTLEGVISNSAEPIPRKTAQNTVPLPREKPLNTSTQIENTQRNTINDFKIEKDNQKTESANQNNQKLEESNLKADFTNVEGKKNSSYKPVSIFSDDSEDDIFASSTKVEGNRKSIYRMFSDEDEEDIFSSPLDKFGKKTITQNTAKESLASQKDATEPQVDPKVATQKVTKEAIVEPVSSLKEPLKSSSKLITEEPSSLRQRNENLTPTITSSTRKSDSLSGSNVSNSLDFSQKDESRSSAHSTIIKPPKTLKKPIVNSVSDKKQGQLNSGSNSTTKKGIVSLFSDEDDIFSSSENVKVQNEKEPLLHSASVPSSDQQQGHDLNNSGSKHSPPFDSGKIPSSNNKGSATGEDRQNGGSHSRDVSQSEKGATPKHTAKTSTSATGASVASPLSPSKKPAGGVQLFGGSELLSKLKARKEASDSESDQDIPAETSQKESKALDASEDLETAKKKEVTKEAKKNFLPPVGPFKGQPVSKPLSSARESIAHEIGVSFDEASRASQVLPNMNKSRPKIHHRRSLPSKLRRREDSTNSFPRNGPPPNSTDSLPSSDYKPLNISSNDEKRKENSIENQSVEVEKVLRKGVGRTKSNEAVSKSNLDSNMKSNVDSPLVKPGVDVHTVGDFGADTTKVEVKQSSAPIKTETSLATADEFPSSMLGNDTKSVTKIEKVTPESGSKEISKTKLEKPVDKSSKIAIEDIFGDDLEENERGVKEAKQDTKEPGKRNEKQENEIKTKEKQKVTERKHESKNFETKKAKTEIEKLEEKAVLEKNSKSIRTDGEKKQGILVVGSSSQKVVSSNIFEDDDDDDDLFTSSATVTKHPPAVTKSDVNKPEVAKSGLVAKTKVTQASLQSSSIFSDDDDDLFTKSENVKERTTKVTKKEVKNVSIFPDEDDPDDLFSSASSSSLFVQGKKTTSLPHPTVKSTTQDSRVTDSPSQKPFQDPLMGNFL